MSKILIIEDNKNQLEVLSDRLKAEGYDVLSASDGETGAVLLAKNICNLALVDIMLPSKNGFDIINEYRRAGGSIPVIFVSAKSELTDKVSGLRLGADDYITKPYDSAELIARIEALLRRTKGITDTAETHTVPDYTDENDYMFGPFKLVFKTVQLLKDGKPLPLSLMECKLLMYLVMHRGQLVKTDTLMEYVWGYESAATSGTLYTHISWLRKKLKTSQCPGGYIKTVRNIGYIFSDQK